MSSRLPIPGQDDGTWGAILNDFLSVEHNTDGTLKKAADIARVLTTAIDHGYLRVQVAPAQHRCPP